MIKQRNVGTVTISILLNQRKCRLLKSSLARFVVYHKTPCDIQRIPKHFSPDDVDFLYYIPPYHAINTILTGGSITGSFLARIRRLSSHNCLESPRKGPRFSIRYFYSAHRSRPRLVNIIAIRNVDVDDVTSAGRRRRRRQRRRRRKGRGETMKRRGDITSSFPLPGVGSGNLPRRRFAKITSRCSRHRTFSAPEISSARCFRSFIAANSGRGRTFSSIKYRAYSTVYLGARNCSRNDARYRGRPLESRYRGDVASEIEPCQWLQLQ